MSSDAAARNRELVAGAFAPWEDGDSGPLFELIADDVRWRVIGTTWASGDFSSKQELIDKAFGRLLAVLGDDLRTRLHDVSADGDKVFLEFESHGMASNGVPYNQEYCWVMKMRAGRAVEIVAYLDTDLLVRVVE
ncbi:MAG: nuclear transport factor 2 family protein [Actinomycetota bacterium]